MSNRCNRNHAGSRPPSGEFHRMGPLESLMRDVYDRFDGDGASGVAAHLDGLVHTGALVKALEMLQARHPKLRSGIFVDKDGKSYFRVLEHGPPIPLQIVDFDEEELPWEKEALSLISQKVNVETGPLCLAKVLQNRAAGRCTLMILAHHAIIDAVSILRLLEDLLLFHDWILNKKETDLVKDGMVQKLPLVTASRLNLTAPLRHRILVLFKLAGFMFRKKWGAWDSLSGKCASGSPIWFKSVLSTEDTAELISRCRQEGTSMYGVICAVAAESLSAVMGGRSRLALRCAVNTRPYMDFPSGAPHIGCFVSGFDKVYDYGPETSFWDFARAARKDVHRFIAQQGPVMALKMLRFMKLPPPDKVRRDTLCVDNLGVANMKGEYGHLHLREISFFVANRNIGVSLMIILCTLKGRLNISIGAMDIDRALLCNFREKFFETLRAVTDADCKNQT